MTATPGGGQGPARGASRRRRDKSGAVGRDPGGSRQAGDQRRKGDPAVATNRRRACGVANVFMRASCGWMRGCTGRAIAREFDHCARAAPAVSMPAWRTCHAWLSEGGTPAWVEGVGLTGADNRARAGAISTNQHPRAPVKPSWPEAAAQSCPSMTLLERLRLPEWAPADAGKQTTRVRAARPPWRGSRVARPCVADLMERLRLRIAQDVVVASACAAEGMNHQRFGEYRFAQ